MRAWGSPVEDTDLAGILRTCEQDRGVILIGARHSGTRTLADLVVRRAAPASTVHTVSARRGDGAHDYAVLEMLGLASPGPSVSPAYVSRQIVEGLTRQLTVIVEDIDFADVLSVRVFSALARHRNCLIVATATDAGSGNVAVLGLPKYSVEPMHTDRLTELVTQRLGGRPTERDLRWLDVTCHGGYNALRWLVDTCEANDRVSISRGVARFSLPDTKLQPAWELEPSLTRTLLGRVLAVVGDTPMPVLRRLVGSEAIATAQEQGTIVVDEALGFARLATCVDALDILFRTTRERRRLIVEEILQHEEPIDMFSPRAAANVTLVADDVGVRVSRPFRHHAVPGLVLLGHTALARRVEPESSFVAAELVLADVWEGEADSARARVEQMLSFAEDSDTVDLEATGLALVLGELRNGPAHASLGDTVDAVMVRLEETADDAAAALGAYRSLVRPSAPRPDWESLRGLRPSTISDARLVRALGFWDLMDGRPEQSLRAAMLADSVHTGSSVDAHLSTILRFLTQLSVPDPVAARRTLPARTPRNAGLAGEDLLWGLLEIYGGSPAAAVAMLSDELPRSDVVFPAFTGIGHAAITLCAAFLGDRDLARTHYEKASEESASPIFEAIRLFVVGAAAAALQRGAAAREAYETFERGRIAAESAGMRALVLPNVVGQRLLVRRAPRRLKDLRPVSVAEEGRPFDGIYARYRRFADAHERSDFIAVAREAIDIHNLGFRLDALGAASTILGVPLPRTLERAIWKLARRRRPDAVPENPVAALLTRREQEVAALVRAGLSDREIATRLHLSVRTVGVHVGRILRKLGVPTRHHVPGALDGED